MGRSLLRLTVGHRARFAVSDSGARFAVPDSGGRFAVSDSGAWGEVCCA